MTRKQGKDAEHIIRLSHDGDGGREIEVWHPNTCEQGAYREGSARDYDCAIAHHLVEWGFDLHLKDVPDGLYLAEYWWIAAGWAGSNPLDAEDGINLSPLKIMEWVDA